MKQSAERGGEAYVEQRGDEAPAIAEAEEAVVIPNRRD